MVLAMVNVITLHIWLSAVLLRRKTVRFEKLKFSAS